MFGTLDFSHVHESGDWQKRKCFSNSASIYNRVSELCTLTGKSGQSIVLLWQLSDSGSDTQRVPKLRRVLNYTHPSTTERQALRDDVDAEYLEYFLRG